MRGADSSFRPEPTNRGRATGSWSLKLQSRAEVRPGIESHSALCPLCPENRKSVHGDGISAKGHVWTAPGWQEESSRCRVGRCSHVFGLIARFKMTAGHNAPRGSGPGQKHAFEDAVGLMGCPDRRIDRHCLTCCS